MKLFIMIGSINMALAVAIGAFGAHGLAGKVTEKMLQNWNTGAHYHIIHALALLAIGLLMSKINGSTSLLNIGGWLIVAGILFFSGSLYAMVLTGVKTWGAITPIGGVAFIAGWILVAVTAAKHL
ncbi:DUF423 domain-containing protein [Laceyella sacchari]|uniref:Uncharacterized membrane protein YgdD, TMEM256/DUF423 family n=1 Tax=Laceyella tengchongensis TaxID=574699 RepID=A0AA46AEM7_9BACL|nr:DUF423 domain-containing protein [Laceyella tengchongensis]AUS09579.1 DUF423 domain-containing protein [Laceyella sacchari]SMP13742.1 Uncharacterized membrane protein YgdD, TMEM256/DUF423 family [Laceyella tengchongensis]